MKKIVRHITKFSGDLTDILIDLPSSSPSKQINKEGIWPIFDSDMAYNHIIQGIRESKSTLLLSSFLIADIGLEEALLDARDRGVRIYLLTASETILNKSASDGHAHTAEQKKHHISMLNSFTGNILCRTSEHLHAKFLLIDPVIERKFNPNYTAFISTANFTTKALTENPEIIVEVSNRLGYNTDILGEFYKFFLHGFWNQAKEELLEKGSWDSVKKAPFEEDIPVPHILQTLNCSDEIWKNSLEEKIMTLLEDLKSADQGFVSVYSLEALHRTSKALLEAAKKNDQITLFTRYRAKNYDFFKLVHNTKLSCYFHKSLHAKFIVYRKNGKYRGVVFTANFSKRGLDEGYEIGIDLPYQQAKFLFNVAKIWNTKMEQKYIPVIKNSNLSKYIGRKLRINQNGQLTEVTIQKEIQVTSEKQTDNFQQYIDTKDLVRENQNMTPKIVLRQTEEITAYAPKLAPSAKESSEVTLNQQKYTTYKTKKRRYIIVSSEEEFFRVKEEAEKNNLRIVGN